MLPWKSKPLEYFIQNSTASTSETFELLDVKAEEIFNYFKKKFDNWHWWIVEEDKPSKLALSSQPQGRTIVFEITQIGNNVKLKITLYNWWRVYPSYWYTIQLVRFMNSIDKVQVSEETYKKLLSNRDHK